MAALRQPRFQIYTASRIFSTMGNMALQAILAWHVYQLTHSALSLGFLGLARFLPALGVALIGGAVADTYNRKIVIMAAQTVPFSCGVILAVATFGHWVSADLIYALVLVIGLASSFENPARLALLPNIVSKETFANAVTVSSTLQSLGMVTGSVLGGALVAINIGASYVFYVCLIGGAFTMMSLVRYQQSNDGPKRSVSVAAIKEGISFVRHRQVLLGAMSLDMFAVIFGGAKGLLPIYATDILHVGGFGYGILLASIDIGSFIMSVLLVFRPPIYRTGRALVYSVTMFGILTMAFGLSRNIFLSIFLYMLIGASDEISVVMRNVIIQLATPDALRGRVSAVSQVFIQASNQLGSMESGFVAAVTSATFAVVSGGAGAVAVCVFIRLRLHELFNYTTRENAEAEVLARSPVEEPSVAAGG